MAVKNRELSLDGKWQIVFDPKNIGKIRKWFSRFPKSQPLSVPGVWEQVKPGYDGVAWYRRTFTASAQRKDEIVRLCFGAVFYYAEVWLNGIFLGDHEGGFSPFEFDVSKYLVDGENAVVVRVIGPPMNYEIDGFRAGAPLNQGNLPVGKAAWYYNFGGIWQSVKLVTTPGRYVSDIFVKPDPFRKKAVVVLALRNCSSKCSTVIACCINGADGKKVASVSRKVVLKKGTTKLVFSMKIKSPRTWSPDEPYLYTAFAEIADGGSDTVRFGMREFGIKNGAFVLNGKPVKLKGFLQQGMYPRTLIFPETPAMARKELMLLKKNGFNFIRAHLKPVTPYVLDMADELGIMIEGEPALGWISNTPETERRCRNEIEGLLRRDRNHACVVFWCLMNEAYHFQGFSMPQIKRLTKRLATIARAIDPTRLMMDTSGGGGNTGDEGTAVMLPNTTRVAAMNDAHAYCPMPVRDTDIKSYRTMGRRGVPLFVSEFGAPDSPPDYGKVLKTYRSSEKKLEDYQLHHDFYESLKDCYRRAGLAKTFGPVEKFMKLQNSERADEMRLITEAMMANPNLAGLVFCQLADASGELFGALDVWRNPKATFKALTAAVKVPLLAPEVTPRFAKAGDSINLLASLVNEDRIGVDYSYRVEVIGRGNKVVKKFTGRIKARSSVQTALKEKLKLTPGSYSLRATLSFGAKTVSNESVSFTVIAAPAVSVPAIAIYDPSGALATFAKRHKIDAASFTNNFRDKSMPVVLDLREGIQNPVLMVEVYGQLKKIIQTGGTAVLLEPDTMGLYEYLFPKMIRWANVSRSAGYVLKHQIFENLQSDCIAGYHYADIYPSRWSSSDDVIAAGGKVLFGGFSSHMWTRPAEYSWGAGVYTIPIGRGEVIVSQLSLLNHLGKVPAAEQMLTNLISSAAGRIRPGQEHLLLSRCIDPITEI